MSETTDGRILVDKLEHHILKITIDRPPVNAMNIDMFGKFYDTLRSIATDDDIRCVVLCSSSMKMFGAGSDVKQYPNLLDDPLQKKLFRRKSGSEHAGIPAAGLHCSGGRYRLRRRTGAGGCLRPACDE